MRMPVTLLLAVGKVGLHLAGVGMAGDIVEVARSIWKLWDRKPAERLVETAAVVGADDQEFERGVVEVVAEVAGDQPEPVRQALALMLKRVQARMRQSQRRPDDPTGRSIRPGLVLEQPEDLIPFLIPLVQDHQYQFHPGERVGADWVLVEPLGVGGFGEVWKAVHAHFDGSFQPVALKFCIDPLARDRLLRHEAKVCARVMQQGRHPGIVALQATYLSADPPFLQYEFVEGGDLGGLIQDWHRQAKPPTAEQIARALLEIAAPVAFAHAVRPNAIVHRDLKPANILVQRVEKTIVYRITDFGIGGIAAARAVQASRQVTTPSEFMTTALRGSCTHLYASPEQLRGEDPDPRDDVHALGVIWLQMLTGDLTEGRPSGDWMEELTGKGVSLAMVKLLGSCFNKSLTRPADAGVLVAKLTALLDPNAPPPDRGVAPAKPPVAPAPARLTNSLGIPLVRIEPGTFTKGGNEYDNEKPPHEVRITRAFYLGAHPVTRGQYRAVTGADPSHFKGVDELPVERVSWFDAVQFCNKLSEMEKRTPCYRIAGQTVTPVNGNGFRLPTEAEWEFACRAGSTTRFPFGDQETDLGQYAWFSGNSGSKTRAVGSKKPNRWGLYDMLGNVWEWCQDGYDEDYYPRSPRDDPPGASGAPSRVIRGGSWHCAPVNCRPALRYAYAPEVRDDYLGFRLAAAQSTRAAP